MDILPQCPRLFYSPLLALPAPKIAGLLCAPKVAGLLPASVGAAACPAHPPVEIIMPPTADELLDALGPIRSRDDMNAELVELFMPHPRIGPHPRPLSRPAVEGRSGYDRLASLPLYAVGADLRVRPEMGLGGEVNP